MRKYSKNEQDMLKPNVPNDDLNINVNQYKSCIITSQQNGKTQAHAATTIKDSQIYEK